MASFSPLRVEAMEPHRWRLLDDLRYTRPTGRLDVEAWSALGLSVVSAEGGGFTVTVAAGYETDFGSAPRMMWWACSPVDIAFAAVVHDKMYGVVNTSGLSFCEKRSLRAVSDSVFFHAILAQPGRAPRWRACVCWASVRMFGWMYSNSPFSRRHRAPPSPLPLPPASAATGAGAGLDLVPQA